MTTRIMICCRGCLIAGLALSMTCAVSLGAPRKRDVWYAYVADGQRYGYARAWLHREIGGDR